ncbi:hypothetical protein Lac2_25610 [Claveliimonas bilis]|uniref:glycosyltransferase n=1 Tax=Claveliimonas bilis TaxID=3028070 RepID=UPI002931A5CC|nr:glycosyltransferase [Claveliimonas bilis]BDZ84427.1 hypothetical protein Lac2_25610 [Claveliimonas bilis]
MKVLVVADGHYYIDKEKKVYVESVFDYSFYARYLSAFDEVYAIVRAESVDEQPKDTKIASGDHVHFLPIPPTRGAKEYALNYLKTRKIVKKYIRDFELAIFRMPGAIANLVSSVYMKTGKKFAIEVVVDPWEYFAKGTVQGISRPFVRLFWTESLKRICQKAVGVSYVTQKYLQKKYPCMAHEGKDGYFTAAYSSVELPDNQFGQSRVYKKKDKYIISHVVNAFTGYGKGHVPLMNAAKIVIDQGYNIEIWFVGDGPLKEDFIHYSEKIGIADNVKFLGRMPSGADVRKKIKKSDVFVFPTRAEGLPRVVLEAMAEGLPVISSPVCGIPEILPRECLISYDDYDGYAEAIIRLIKNPDLMTRYSVRNIDVAKEYKSSILNVRRQVFYLKLRNQISNE